MNDKNELTTQQQIARVDHEIFEYIGDLGDLRDNRLLQLINERDKYMQQLRKEQSSVETYAFLKAELLMGDFKHSSEVLPPNDWRFQRFKCMVLDGDEACKFHPKDHPQGFNMIIMHPLSKKLIWVNSSDFEFC